MDKSTALNPAYSRIPALDGIRGVAIALVLIVHFYYRGPQITSSPISKEYFIFGWTGVELFFVLSGFLITSILLKAKKAGGNLSAFYINRSARILPLYVVFLGALLLASYISLPPPLSNSLLNFREYFFTYFFYISNFAYIAGWDLAKADILLSPTWSLAVEQHFYLFWPLLVLFLSEKLTRRVIACVYIAMVTVRLYLAGHMNPDVVYHTTFLHFDGLAIGSLAAMYLPAIVERIKLVKSVAVISFVLMIVLFASQGTFHYKNQHIFSLGIPLVNVFYCSFMICIMSSKSLSRVFSMRPLTILGKYSYCIYLLHWPMLMIFSQVKIEANMAMWAALCLSFTLVLLVMARVSWVLIEKPSSNFIRKLKNRK